MIKSYVWRSAECLTNGLTVTRGSVSNIMATQNIEYILQILAFIVTADINGQVTDEKAVCLLTDPVS